MGGGGSPHITIKGSKIGWLSLASVMVITARPVVLKPFPSMSVACRNRVYLGILCKESNTHPVTLWLVGGNDLGRRRKRLTWGRSPSHRRREGGGNTSQGTLHSFPERKGRGRERRETSVHVTRHQGSPHASASPLDCLRKLTISPFRGKQGFFPCSLGIEAVGNGR